MLIDYIPDSFVQREGSTRPTSQVHLGPEFTLPVFEVLRFRFRFVFIFI